MRTTLIKLLPLVALTAVLTAVIAGCGGSSSDSNKISLVAYSTPKEAYAALIPAFKKTPQGKGVTFTQSYGPSGDQSRAVDGGLPADVVEFSLEPDITRLVDSGLVDKSWNQNQYKGMVTNSVVVLVTRKGNPKHITKLGRPGQAGRAGDHAEPVHVAAAPAGTSWPPTAARSSRARRTPQATAFLGELFKNVAGAGQERTRRARRPSPAARATC